jgi:hypothetical protein
MAFSWKKFFTVFVQAAPAIAEGALELKNETGNVPDLTEAADALHLATGVTEALGQDDPAVVADAQLASSIIMQSINTIGTITAKPAAGVLGSVAPNGAAVTS